jgi:hypothetical protein
LETLGTFYVTNVNEIETTIRGLSLEVIGINDLQRGPASQAFGGKGT